MQKGFTLLEVLIAIMVVTIGVGGAFALIQQTTSFTSNASSQLVAVYLAQEGIEIVRNIRDTNFLRIHQGQEVEGQEVMWNDGISSHPESLSLGGVAFTRNTTITADGEDDELCPAQGDERLCVLVKISWEKRGRSYGISAATELYNWLTPTPDE